MRHRRCTSATTRSSPGSARCRSRCSRPSTGPRSASAARSRWPATSSSPRESAYFLLAFVNIGLVPDGGSSLLVPERVGFARAAEMAMLGERIDAATGARVGPDRTARCPTTTSTPRSTRWPSGSPPAPPRLRGDQAPAQRLAVRPHGRQLELEADSSRSRRRRATSSRASRRSCRSDRPRSRVREIGLRTAMRPLRQSAGRPRRLAPSVRTVHILARPWLPCFRNPVLAARRWRSSLPIAVLASLALAPCRLRRPASSRSPAARRTPTTSGRSTS